jgi:hypothetical protein
MRRMALTQERITASLLELARAFQAAGIPFAVAGAHAVAMHGHTRATTDIDFLVRSDDRERAARVMGALGYAQFHSSPGFALFERTPVPELPGLRERADLLFSTREMGALAIQQAIAHPTPWHGQSIPAVDLVTLMLMKVMAVVDDPRRLQDIVDLRGLVRANRQSLDLEALRRGADQIGPDVRVRLDELLAEFAVQEARPEYDIASLRL